MKLYYYHPDNTGLPKGLRYPHCYGIEYQSADSNFDKTHKYVAGHGKYLFTALLKAIRNLLLDV